MESKTDMSKLSKVDELSVRKVYIKNALSEAEKQVKDDVMLLLGGAFIDNPREKAEGLVVFLERWVKDIDEEIENL